MAAEWDGAKWLPERQISRTKHREFVSEIAVDAKGRPWVAWIRLEDVRDEGGVIDQKTSIMCANLERDDWRIHEDVALLYQGLLATEGIWGYLGRRRRPMIAADKTGGVHLFYEIKKNGSGPTSQATGLLLMRHWDGKAWSDTYELCREDYGYQIARPGELSDNHLMVVARRGWEEGQSEIVAHRINLFNLQPAEVSDPSEWDRWKPCDLLSHPRTD